MGKNTEQDLLPFLTPFVFNDEIKRKQIEEEKNKEKDRERKKKEARSRKYRKTKERNRFAEEIALLVNKLMQIDPDRGETIKDASCFGKGWIEGDDIGTICPARHECDLKNECRQVWGKVRGSAVNPVSSGYLHVGDKRTVNKAQTAGTYVDQGRGIDKIAKMIWEAVGEPPSITKVVLPKNLPQDGHLRVIKRPSYHRYVRGNTILMRLWTNTNAGGWLDVSEKLARLMKEQGIVLAPTTTKEKHTNYPFRIYLIRQIEVDQVCQSLKIFLDLPLGE